MSLWNKIKSACAGLSPNCREAVRAQSEALDHPLPPARRFGLWMHLLICKWCRRYSRQIHFMHAAAGELPDKMAETGPQKLSDDARKRMKLKLKDQP
jgi:hypothetical protein